MWEGVTAVDAVVSGKDGKTYFFSGDEYFRFSGDDYCHLDNGYPRKTNRLWGNVKNNIAEYGNVDAALVVESREEEEQEDGTTETVKTMHTYLFSGDQFFRYKNYDLSYTNYDLSLIALDNVDDLPKTGKNVLIVARINADGGNASATYHARIFDITGQFLNKDNYDVLSDEILVQEFAQLFEQLNIPINQPIETDDLAKSKLIRKTISSLGHAYYGKVEPGYPKAIGLLKDEPRFKDLDMMLDEGIDAAFSDRRNVYLLKDSTFHIVSDEPCAKYLGRDETAFMDVDCAFMDQGAVYLESSDSAMDGWHHISNLEGRDSGLPGQDIVLTPEMPPLLVDVDIPPNYKIGLNAVFQGTDTNTYLFKGDTFFNQGLNREFSIAEQWGRVRNNIQDRKTIDAGFVGRDGKTYVFSGDQYVVYDTLVYSSDIGLTMEYDLNVMPLENAEALPSEGKSLIIVAKIGESYYVRIFNSPGNMSLNKEPDEFVADVGLVQELDAALTRQRLDDQTKSELIQKITSNLGYALTAEVFQESERISAVNAIADHWGGLTSVHVAYVMEEYTYLFEKPDYDGTFRYVRYSSTDYEQPDPGFPKVANADFWDIPTEYQEQGWDTFDAIEFENNDTLLII